MDDNDLNRRLRELFERSGAENFNTLDFLHAEGSPLLALMYARLFWPDFVEFDQMVFMTDTVEDAADQERIQAALQRNSGNRMLVERSFNLREVEDLFGARIGESTDTEDQALMMTLREMWEARLKSLYPDRQFKVLVIPPSETGGTVGVTFYECR